MRVKNKQGAVKHPAIKGQASNARPARKHPRKRYLSAEMLETLIRESPVHPAAARPPRKPPFELQDD